MGSQATTWLTATQVKEHARCTLSYVQAHGGWYSCTITLCCHEDTPPGPSMPSTIPQASAELFDTTWPAMRTQDSQPYGTASCVHQVKVSQLQYRRQVVPHPDSHPRRGYQVDEEQPNGLVRVRLRRATLHRQTTTEFAKVHLHANSSERRS